MLGRGRGPQNSALTQHELELGMRAHYPVVRWSKSRSEKIDPARTVCGVRSLELRELLVAMNRPRFIIREQSCCLPVLEGKPGFAAKLSALPKVVVLCKLHQLT